MRVGIMLASLLLLANCGGSMEPSQTVGFTYSGDA